MTNATDQNGDGAEYVHELTPNELPSEVVYTAVAAVSDRPVVDLEPLAHVLNPDALDRLFDRPSDLSSPNRVEFDYCGYRVVVTADAVRLHEEDRTE